MTKDAYVIGAGGQGKVVVRLLQTLGYTVRAVYDDDRSNWDDNLLGVPVQGPIESMAKLGRVESVVAIGDNKTRKAIASQLDLDWLTAIHPSAFVESTASLGAGTVVLPHATVHVDAVIGKHVIVNTAATVEHDCTIEDFAHLAPGSTLAGAVHIEQGVLMGVGTSTTVSVRVGAWSTVGVGAVVVSDLPASCVAKGVPARPAAVKA